MAVKDSGRIGGKNTVSVGIMPQESAVCKAESLSLRSRYGEWE
jgi:hypothetical protein